MSGADLTARLQYQSLQKYFAKTDQQHLRDRLVADPNRGERLAAGLHLDRNAAAAT